MKKTTTKLLAITAVLASAAMAYANPVDDAKGQFSKIYPDVPVDKVSISPIPGMYEVESRGNLLYFLPKEQKIIIGDIIDSGKKNLTTPKRKALQEKAMQETATKGKTIFEKNLDLAVKVGSGKTVVIEISDPDCPYCRRADEFLSTRKDVTRYIFLSPLDSHRNAPAKVKQIFAAADPAKKLEEVFAGKLDSNPPQDIDNALFEERMKKIQKLATSAGLNGTPAFYINGEFVNGANIPKLKELLDGKK